MCVITQEVVRRIRYSVTVDDNNCWNWSGRLPACRVVIGIAGRKVSLRRTVYALYGLTPTLGSCRIAMSCQNPHCCAPHHMTRTFTRKGGRPKGQYGRGWKHPWSTWVARGTVTLVQGQDFGCGTPCMMQQVRNYGIVHGLKVSMRATDDTLKVVFSCQQ